MTLTSQTDITEDDEDEDEDEDMMAIVIDDDDAMSDIIMYASSTLEGINDTIGDHYVQHSTRAEKITRAENFARAENITRAENR